MNILVKLIYFVVLIWVLLTVYKLYEGEMHIRAQHKQLAEQRMFLLAASDYYLWKNAPTINNELALNVVTSAQPFTYQGEDVYVGWQPQGSFCIYRVVLHNNQTKQLFFCLN